MLILLGPAESQVICFRELAASLFVVFFESFISIANCYTAVIWFLVVVPLFRCLCALSLSVR